MSQMSALYEKVAADPSLQEKFNRILQDAEKAGEAETQNRLLSFAKEAGYDVSIDEMQRYFEGLAAKQEGELSEAELDMVAGGKYNLPPELSKISMYIGCLMVSISLIEGCTGG